MSNEEREAVAADMLPRVRRMARKRAGVVDAAELESVGGVAVAEALDTFDPDRGTTVRQHCTATVIGRMKDAIRQAGGSRRKVKLPHVRPFATDAETGEQMVPADRRAVDPAASAVARERLAALCSPGEAAVKAAALRAAMFGAVTAADIGDVMKGLVGRAKGSDKSARLLLQLVGLTEPLPAIVPVAAEDVA
jgi:DNA-directed RNA polymerase specialized sigma24 family protein